MHKSVEALHRDLAGIRTGRASPGLIENLKIDYYGAATPLNQLATITVPEARLLVIQPWDRSAMGIIEKSILKSDLGLNPNNDGKVIRLQIPQLTAERRKDLAKMVHKRVEEGRVAVRNCRRDGLERLRALQKNKELSDDDEKRAQDQLQKLTDRYIAEVDRAGQLKEAELMEV
jgi:ribosome recycling factor